jgi:hypothetical protein
LASGRRLVARLVRCSTCPAELRRDSRPMHGRWTGSGGGPNLEVEGPNLGDLRLRQAWIGGKGVAHTFGPIRHRLRHAPQNVGVSATQAQPMCQLGHRLESRHAVRPDERCDCSVVHARAVRDLGCEILRVILELLADRRPCSDGGGYCPGSGGSYGGPDPTRPWFSVR